MVKKANKTERAEQQYVYVMPLIIIDWDYISCHGQQNNNQYMVNSLFRHISEQVY
jgi:hypothetical protein